MICLVRLIIILGFSGLAAAGPGAGAKPSPSPAPRIASLMKPAVLKRVIEGREIMTHASLVDDTYSFYAAMLTRSTVAQVKKAMMDFSVYAKLIPYIDRSDFSPATGILALEGGIWKFRLASWVRVEDRGPGWLHYSVVAGHFRGLSGDFFFEQVNERDTAIYFGGEQRGKEWPPRLIIEKGAEIVFGFTGKKMKSHIESQKAVVPEKAPSPIPDLPQPRKTL